MKTDYQGGPASAARIDSGSTALSGNRPSWRRQYLIDHRHQLRAGAWTALAVAVLLVLLNASLYGSNLANRAFVIESVPELREFIVAQDRSQMSLAILGSVVFVAGVFALCIVETNRTAGPAWRLHKLLMDLERGAFGRQMKLRPGDNLWSLARAFNSLSTTLHERTAGDVQDLERLASELEQLSSDPRLAEIAGRLRHMARSKSEHLV